MANLETAEGQDESCSFMKSLQRSRSSILPSTVKIVLYVFLREKIL